jgi:hypothetical protein
VARTRANTGLACTTPPLLRTMPRVANCGATADCEGADGAAPIIHGVGAAWPMVNDSEIVALNESVMEKNSTLIDTETEIPASKPTWIGW